MGFGKQNTGVIIREDSSQALGALANNTAILVASGNVIGGNLQEDFRLLKSEILAHVDILTAGEGEGLIFGIANGELSVAEIAEAIQANGPLDRNDRLPQERAERNVKLLGTYDMRDITAVSGKIKGDNGGPLIVSKHRWTYSNPEAWNFFVFNDGIVLTTGAQIRLVATHYGVWVT